MARPNILPNRVHHLQSPHGDMGVGWMELLLLGASCLHSPSSWPCASSHPPTGTQGCTGLSAQPGSLGPDSSIGSWVDFMSPMLPHRHLRGDAQDPCPPACQAVRAVFILQTFGTQQARSGSRVCTPPTTTRPTPASWYETCWEVGEDWASLAWGVRGKGPSNTEGAPEVSHDLPGGAH